MHLESAQNVTERTNAVIATVKAIHLVSTVVCHNVHIVVAQEFVQLVIFQGERRSQWADQVELFNSKAVAVEVARSLKYRWT